MTVDFYDPTKEEGVKERGTGVCWTINRKESICSRAIEIDKCFIRLNFFRHPLGVLQNVDDPLIIHFAGKRYKKLFEDFAKKQNENCASPYRYQNIKVTKPLGPTSLILTALPAVVNISIDLLLRHEFDEKDKIHLLSRHLLNTEKLKLTNLNRNIFLPFLLRLFYAVMSDDVKW
eukprot:GHVP01018119.1.p1 GENE.GHVP01018119.1~~GHVP01018119.1.p1  ORF type:complete len:175 (+),score=26.71 GHVP01018119.1:156-680(+)